MSESQNQFFFMIRILSLCGICSESNKIEVGRERRNEINGGKLKIKKGQLPIFLIKNPL